MARAIDIDITPSAIHSNKAIRGFTNIPGYTFPDENIATEFIPEDYWKTGKSYTGEALQNLPPEEIAKFEQRQREPADISREPIDTSIDDIARMTPGEQGPAMDEMIGPRPSISTLKENLISKAEANFSRHYWKTMNRPPSKDAVEGFYQKVQKDPRILSETKAQLQEYDKNRATLEKQVSDTRQRKKVVDTRYKDAVVNARKKTELLDPKERQGAMRTFLKELNFAMVDPANMEEKIAMAIAGIPGIEKDGITEAKAREKKYQIAKYRNQLEATGGMNEMLFAMIAKEDPELAESMRGKRLPEAMEEISRYDRWLDTFIPSEKQTPEPETIIPEIPSRLQGEKQTIYTWENNRLVPK